MNKPHSKPNALDREELDAWKASPITQWVLAQCRAEAERIAGNVKDNLFYGAASNPNYWAEQQPNAAYQLGIHSGLLHFIDVQVEEPEA